VKSKVQASPAKQPQHRPSRKNRFRRVETRRLIRSCREEGLSIARIECDSATGKVTIYPGAPVESATDDNTWDSVLTK
jgi:hypothetical protein